MATATGKPNDLEEALKPFHQRAYEAEERLTKLESMLTNKNDDSDADNKEMSKSNIIKDFQSKLEIAQADLMAERDKSSKEIQKLTTENLKLQYCILHLRQALREADSKLGKIQVREAESN